MFGGCDFQQTFDIPMGTNYSFLFSDIPAAFLSKHYT